MVKQREGYKFVILEPAKTWLAEDKCAGCGKEKSEWKRSKRWKCCSKECTQKYVRESTYYEWAQLRRKAIMRDMKCIKCGIQHTKEILTSPNETYYKHYEIILEQSTEYLDDSGYPTVKLIVVDMSQYVVDHIQAIALDGEEWDIENLQTLCKECNKHKTRKDIGKIAKLRLKEQLIRAGQKFLDEKQ
jgi:5-methylcytosine-specific restriction endonuclease McrA